MFFNKHDGLFYWNGRVYKSGIATSSPKQFIQYEWNYIDQQLF